MNNDIAFSGFQLAKEKGSQPDRPKIVLIGSAMRFSDRMLEVFRSEFMDFEFLRLNQMSDIISARADLGELGLVVFEDHCIQSILDNADTFADAVGSTQIVIAFTETRNAARFLSERPATGQLDNVGFLPLNAQMEVWLAVMRLLLCGHTFIPQELVAELHAAPVQPGADQIADQIAETTLTPREWQVLELVAEGVQNKNIAVDLDLSVHTVKLHIHNLLSKIGVTNRTCAASWYMQSQGRRPVGQHVSNA